MSAPQGRVSGRNRVAVPGRHRVYHERDIAGSQPTRVIYYQPRLDLRSGHATGAQAVLRPAYRRRTTVIAAGSGAPDDGLNCVGAITGWTLLEACRDAQGWSHGVVAVRASAQQLHAGVLLGDVARALEASGLAPDRLELALAESALADTDLEMLLTLSAMRDLGVGVALDDFGAGLASLGLLKRLPLTAMKLDRGLLRDLPGHREDAAILRAVIDAGHALGLSVVADGVETESQRALLSGYGCDEGQGCLFGDAQPGSAIRTRMHPGWRSEPPPLGGPMDPVQAAACSAVR